MSLKHAFTDLIADDPALPTFVRPSNWNDEHTFPGAGAGEVVYVDGDGHAATSANLTFDAANSQLRCDNVAAYDLSLIADVYGTPFTAFNAAASGGGSTQLHNANTAYLTLAGDDTLSFSNAAGEWAIDPATCALYPKNFGMGGNLLDLGTSMVPLHSGYFGTSVVVDDGDGGGTVSAANGYLVAGTPGITDTIDLATATSISVVGGIIVGWE